MRGVFMAADRLIGTDVEAEFAGKIDIAAVQKGTGRDSNA